MPNERIKNGLGVALLIALFSLNAAAQDRRPIDVGKARVIEHWTSERRAGAIPRDLVIDPRGLGYMRRPGGVLVPYGHNVAAQEAPREATPWPFGKPSGGRGGSSDTTLPEITGMNPGEGSVIPSAHTFSATVTDASGVKSVTFKVQKIGGVAQSFSATKSSDNLTWSVALTGFSDGQWNWWVVAKDLAGKGGNTATSSSISFSVGTTGSGGGGGTGTVTNAQWPGGGAVQAAAGRLYFEMPANSTQTYWNGYVCSGTVATDSTSNRSIIITAAHCVYDDAHKAFARNVMFIPNQAGTSGAGTDLNCNNDPLGCWVPSFGVVDENWTLRTFPDNIAWDYAFYVVADSGAHQGTTTTTDALDGAGAAGSMSISFAAPSVNDGTAGANTADFTDALGYSYNEDPKLMYCAEDMTTQGAVNWWLPSCGLSGGSSGGPWLQPIVAGSGDIISVNSWGYTNQPGMAGPKLVGTSASCIFTAAKNALFDGNRGAIKTCP